MLAPFLTAYDPSDLPGGSVDPLGFERGYLLLADKILPGLTNAGDRPRYLSVLCAGASLIDDQSAATPRRIVHERLECVQRLERLWGLACVLASNGNGIGNGDLEVGGLRGVTYYRAQAERVGAEERRRADARFTVLARQTRYGAVGIYGAIAHGLRLWERRTLLPSADLGARLAEAFLDETGAPPALRRAVRDDGDLSIERLAEWGRAAHVAGRVTAGEARCLAEAVHRDPVRSRMAEAAATCPAVSEEPEMTRLARIRHALQRRDGNADLCEALAAILAYERAFQVVQLGFERLLWLARNSPSGAAGAAELAADAVFDAVREALPRRVGDLRLTLDGAGTPHCRQDLDRLADVRAFLESTAQRCGSAAELGEAILARHADVQRGKFDRGRRKMPWVEQSPVGIVLTSARVGGLEFEATEAEDIAPHPYRLLAADRFLAAARTS